MRAEYRMGLDIMHIHKIKLLGIVMALSGFAVCATDVETEPAALKELYVVNTDDFNQLRVDPFVSLKDYNPAGCMFTKYAIFDFTDEEINPAKEARSIMVSMLLSAYLERKKIALIIDDTTCINDRPVIVGVRFNVNN